MSETREPCPFCGVVRRVVHVHGHGQCSHCGINIEPCCTGANAHDEAGSSGEIASDVDAGLLARLFVDLGGATATVTEASLLFALTQHLGRDLDEARLVLEAAERLGIVEPLPGHLFRLRPPA